MAIRRPFGGGIAGLPGANRGRLDEVLAPLAAGSRETATPFQSPEAGADPAARLANMFGPPGGEASSAAPSPLTPPEAGIDTSAISGAPDQGGQGGELPPSVLLQLLKILERL